MNYAELVTHREALNRIALKYHIKEIQIFGSTARNEATVSSDIDFLVELQEGASALGIGGFSYEAERLLGVKVDVIPTFALSKIEDTEFAQTIRTTAVLL